ncbi:MAG TPA: hypothetical protein VMV49_13365, partial [Candidatus Deferrimicrobium sp.]|nr:hypothetical protein [Candidatus Deferrimicrobium sp.]
MNNTEPNYLAKITFNKFNFSHIISAILLLFLPIFNFPFTSQQGSPYTFRFFLDFNLLAGLDTTRNLIEVFFPIPIYYVIGVLPGIFGLFLLIYSFLSGAPNWLYLSAEDVKLIETKIFLKKKDQCSLSGLQIAKIGKRRFNIKAWLFFLFLSICSIYLFMYTFGSLKNTGTFYYFGVIQNIWDGNNIIGHINFGFQLLITSIILFIAPLLTIIFTNRDFHVETNESVIKFSYSSFKVKILDNSNLWENNSLIVLLKNIEELKQTKLLPIDKNYIERQSSTNNIDIIKNSYLPSYIPKFKMSLYILAIIILSLAQFLPHWYLGSFTFPFIAMGLIVIFYFLLTAIHTEWFSIQKILQSNNDCFIL